MSWQSIYQGYALVRSGDNFDLIAAGISFDEIVNDHPELERTDSLLRWLMLRSLKDTDFKNSHFINKTPKEVVQVTLAIFQMPS